MTKVHSAENKSFLFLFEDEADRDEWISKQPKHEEFLPNWYWLTPKKK